MKILLAAAIVAAVAAAACAMDLGGWFRGCSKAKAPEASPAAPAGAPGQADGVFPPSVKPEEALRFIETRKPVVIDIRTAEEHAAGYISPTHLTLDYYAPDFKDRLAKLDKNAGYLLYCRSGRRSGAALQLMKELGFADSHDLAGGITAWSAAGLPVVK